MKHWKPRTTEPLNFADRIERAKRRQLNRLLNKLAEDVALEEIDDLGDQMGDKDSESHEGKGKP